MRSSLIEAALDAHVCSWPDAEKWNRRLAEIETARKLI
jgi:hypothetical protein